MDESTSTRRNQILGGALICGTVMCGSVGLLLGWRIVPGFFGEWLGMLAGVISTPFFLEATFFCIGLTIVVLLNQWRRKREGDEFVYLEEVEGPDVPAGLPDQARWAIYSKPPLAGEEPDLIARIEGALSIGDATAAAELLAEMPERELRTTEILALRLELARVSGNRGAQERLEQEIAERQLSKS